jgi:tight adherence protein C
MNGMSVLALSATFVAVILMTFGFLMASSSWLRVRRRVEEPEAPPSLAVMLPTEEEHPLKKRLFKWLSLPGKWTLKDPEDTSQVRALLVQGGFRRQNAPALFYGCKALLGLIAPVPFMLYALIKENFTVYTVLIALFLGIGGYLLPRLILQWIINQRQDKLDKTLPDVIDLLIVCMEAGMSLPAALSMVSEEIRDVSKTFFTELQITVGEMRAGITRDSALRNLGTRTGVASIQSLVSLMNQSEKMGTSVAKSLRSHADFTRVQRTLRVEEAAGKLPVKIMFPLICFIFPTIFIVIIGPGVIGIVKHLFPVLAGR